MWALWELELSDGPFTELTPSDTEIAETVEAFTSALDEVDNSLTKEAKEHIQGAKIVKEDGTDNEGEGRIKTVADDPAFIQIR